MASITTVTPSEARPLPSSYGIHAGVYFHPPPTSPLGGNPELASRLQGPSTESPRPRSGHTLPLLRHGSSPALDHPPRIQRVPRTHAPSPARSNWSINNSSNSKISLDVETPVLRPPSPDADGPTASPRSQLVPTPVSQNPVSPPRVPTEQQQRPLTPSHILRPGALASRQTDSHRMPGKRARRQSKWTQAEDERMIELRGSGMKWEDISRNLPGRSSISCRLHYQNYLERRSEWDEDRRDKLAQLYERYDDGLPRSTWFYCSREGPMTLTKPAGSKPRCGQRLPQSWEFRGVQRRPCTG